MRRVLFVLSLILNVVLVALLIWFYGYNKKKVSDMAMEFKEAQACRAKQILEDLESGSAEKIEAVKEKLRESVEKGKEAISDWRGSSEKEGEDTQGILLIN